MTTATPYSHTYTFVNHYDPTAKRIMVSVYDNSAEPTDRTDDHAFDFAKRFGFNHDFWSCDEIETDKASVFWNVWR